MNMRYRHRCPHCGSRYFSDWFYTRHLKLHHAASVQAEHTPAPMTPLTAKYFGRLERAIARHQQSEAVFAALVQAAKERR